MSQKLNIYNSLSRKKEEFKPLHPPFVGMYVCGPTVYGEPHLGHARAAIVFDILYRYLKQLGYKVRYIRNITDVGHLENDADEGEDKIEKRARLEQLEPMEIAHLYTYLYFKAMEQLNVHTPSIEPTASGHIPEQIELIQQLIDKGFAYIVNGNIYFDLIKYASNHDYGKLSGKIIDDLINNSRELSGQTEKKNPVDFALWKKATPAHIMRWKSPWGEGFPGWHLECSVMSAKYLEIPFDIHGGGLDLMFPHHESEIAQSVAGFGHEPCKYWIHNNLITINGQKMSKSLGNFITLNELFSGNHKALEKAFCPMAVRFFILQAHYRSTLDFSNEALKAAEKGYERLMQSFTIIEKIQPSDKSSIDIQAWVNQCYTHLNDDMNTALLMADLFEAVKYINLAIEKKETLTSADLDMLKEHLAIFAFDILGLRSDEPVGTKEITDNLMKIILELRLKVRQNKDFAASDMIRDKLKEAGIQIKDSKDGADWEFNIK